MNDEIKEQEKYGKLILELTDLDIKTNGKLNDIQRVQLDLYKKIYLLLKKINLLREENNGVRKGFNQLQFNWNSLREWLEERYKITKENSSSLISKYDGSPLTRDFYEAVINIQAERKDILDKMNELEGKNKQ